MFQITEAKELKPITVTDSEGKKVKLKFFQDKKSGVDVQAIILCWIP